MMIAFEEPPEFGEHEQRDKPLSYSWRALDAGWIEPLGLPPARSKAHSAAREAVLLDAVITGAYKPERWISYSRRHDWWADARRNRGTAYSYATVVPAVDELSALGLLEHQKRQPGGVGWQSRFRATSRLLNLLVPPAVIWDPVEVIRLKDRDGCLIDYRDTNRTIRMRARLEEINEALGSTRIELLDPQATFSGHVIRIGANVLYPAMNALYRVFNRGSFALGGRFYGGWWQQASKDIRSHLAIDGCRTVELDYPQLHPSMLYAEVGSQPEGDIYTVQGWDRAIVKVALLILINAGTHDAAVRAIAQGIGGEGAHAEAARLIQAIKDRHPLIAGFFHSDAGIRLMKRDSDMAEEIMRRLLARGVVVLPIHDSFIAPDAHASQLCEAMSAAWRHHVGTDSSFLSMDSLENVPHMASPRLPLVVLLPLYRQPDLFGGRPVPSSLSSWSRGIAPPAVRGFLRDQLRSTGLSQYSVAHQVGISPAQLCNGLRGRYGFSPTVVSRLKLFVFQLAQSCTPTLQRALAAAPPVPMAKESRSTARTRRRSVRPALMVVAGAHAIQRREV